MPEPKRTEFSKKFLWGASLSAHQSEGNTHNQWSVWELESAKSLAAQAGYKESHVPVWDQVAKQATNPANYISGENSDHYTRYEEDFELLQSLNLSTLRFSIEWSRIEPKEGTWDSKEIQHYRAYFESLTKRGIEPVVTLFHFTLPVWFSERGGFEKRTNVKYYIRFVEKVLAEFGRNLRYIITINEPEVYARESYLSGNWPPQQQSRLLAYKVLKNLLHAHKQAAKVIHASNRRFRVSIAKNSPYCYPGDDALLSRISTEIYQYVVDDYILKRVVKSCDFIGVNYYFSNRFYGYRIHNPERHLSDLDWSMEPANIQFVLERLHRKYKKPIMVTENGLADRADSDRKWWLTQTLLGMRAAMKEGIPVLGYIHWSLLDNFEWAHGSWPRFGLVEVDYKTKRRSLRSSAQWYGGVVKRLRSGANQR